MSIIEISAVENPPQPNLSLSSAEMEPSNADTSISCALSSHSSALRASPNSARSVN